MIAEFKVSLGPLPWWWVAVEAMNKMFGKDFDVRRFLALSKDRPDSIAIAVCTDRGYEFLNAVINDGKICIMAKTGAEEVDYSKIFVPLGFALDVEWAISLGVDHVICEDHRHIEATDACPEGTLRCAYVDGRHVAAVGLDKNEEPVVELFMCGDCGGVWTAHELKNGQDCPACGHMTYSATFSARLLRGPASRNS